MLINKRKNSEEKQKAINKKLIGIIICTIAIHLIFLWAIANNVIVEEVTLASVKSNQTIQICNVLMSIVAVAFCILYYNENREEDMFYIFLIYLNVSLEMILNIYTVYKREFLNEEIQFYFLCTYTYRVVLMLCLTSYNKIAQSIINNKRKSIIFNVGLTVIGYILSVQCNIVFSNKIKDMIVIVSIIIGIMSCFAITRLFIKSYKTKNIIYAVISLSISLLNLRCLVKCIYFFKYSKSVFVFTAMLTFICCLLLIIGFFVLFMDKIESMKETKKDLYMFKEIIENNAYNQTLIYDKDHYIIYANKTMRENVCGKGKNIEEEYEILSKSPVFERLKEDETEYIRNMVNSEGRFVGQVKSDKGEIFELNLIKENICNDECYIMFATEITEEFSANEKLRINKKKLSGITDNITELIATFDLDGKIEYINSAGLKILNTTLDDVKGVRYEEFIDNKITFLREFIKAKSEESALIVHNVHYKDSKPVEVESIVRKLLDEDKKVKGYIIVSRSTKMKKEFERIRLKYEEIKEYDKIRTEFFANLSHEVRTPINIIYSTIQLLNKEKNNGIEAVANYYIKYEKTISQNCLRILRLVNNIIDLSRYDAGFFKPNFKNYDIVSVVEDTTMSTIPFCKNKDINLMFDTDVEELFVKLDATQMERVVLNLVANAVKFTPRGGDILVLLSVNKYFVDIRIKDSGPGIEKDMQEFIFERFVQTDKSLKRKQEGSGIGLAIVKSIVNLHEGIVKVEESDERGTTILVRIPNITMEGECEENNMIEGSSLNEKAEIEFSDIY
ncbi:PAS domain-containing protein [Clostridium sp. MSJ-8]|uniref:sensor histidine kinase n=1 Tax=Clostridium sp. MSJ-8 TaxID=2841510 RepID=UPI001C0E97FC|nr:ATP-binding protein [Clostridium sp. MSJ-8]MBU5487813.1 PAS domain-containing protein [Clostridium sp. MSJ-8]